MQAGSGRSWVPSWSCLHFGSKPLWHIPLLCVQWKTPDDGQRNCPKDVDFYSKYKFEKLEHLVGFIIRIRKNKKILFYFDVCTVHLLQFIIQSNKCTTHTHTHTHIYIYIYIYRMYTYIFRCTRIFFRDDVGASKYVVVLTIYKILYIYIVHLLVWIRRGY